ncbi:MAG: hypothetical protein N2504_06615 [candidate division WOR-3 bacterium]|nr:hypothetical protein [candidate division WOR-3 bacterium]
MLNIKLSEFPFTIKLAFICFYIFVILGFIFAHLILHFKLEGSFTPQDFINYYKGNETLLKFQKTPLELSEVSHFHSFISPVIAFILAFFFSFSKLSENMKIIVILASFISSLFLVINPWLLTLGPTFFVYLKYISSIVLVISYLFMGACVIYEFFKNR